jgi:hypothetical protein
MFLTSADVLKQIDAADVHVGDPFPTPGGPLLPTWFGSLPGSAYRLLHDTGACAGCLQRWDGWLGLGVFVFSGEVLEWADAALWEFPNLPYCQTAAPLHPLRLDDLPPGLRAEAAAVRFDALRFVSSQYLQPIEHVPCEMWADADDPTVTYLASDLKTHLPFPRRK